MPDPLARPLAQPPPSAMPLAEIEFSWSASPLPDEIREFLDVADARITQYFQNQAPRPSGFVPSDFVTVYHALRAIMETNLAPGQTFCEWGSGFGVVASLAAMLGFEAYGIEINRDLIDAARELAAEFELPVQFAHGSLIPAGDDDVVDEAYAQQHEDLFFLATDGESG